MIEASQHVPRGQVEEALLHCATGAARMISVADDVERGLSEALCTVAPALQADRAWAFQAPAEASGPLHMHALWQRDDLAATEAEAYEALTQTTLAGWHRRLGSGVPVQARTADLPDTPEREALEAHGVEATLVLPVRVQGRYWGGLRFDAGQRTASGWPHKQIAALETLASALAQRLETQTDAVEDAPASREDAIHETTAQSKPPSRTRGAVVASAGALQAAILAQISEAVLVVDRDGTAVFLNRKAEELFDVAANEAAGMPVHRLLPAYPAWIQTEAARQAFEAGEAWQTEMVQRCDGAPQYLEVALSAAEAPGAHAHVVAMVRDVTQARRRKRQLEHRARMERTLADVSTLFVSPGDFEPEELLSMVGQTLEADRVYLITAPPDDRATAAAPPWGDGQTPPAVPRLSAARASTRGWPIDLNAYTYREWCAPEAPAAAVPPGGHAGEGGLAAFAVPVLSPQDKLYGYLGIEYAEAAPDWLEEGSRMLGVLGDMMAAYLERRIAETALRESEERYRLFVTAISEGIWCIEPAEPVALDAPLDAPAQALRERGIIVDCNESMAHALGYGRAGHVIGRPASEVIPEAFDRELFRDLLAGGGALENRECTLSLGEGPVRHVVVNAVGTVENGALVRVWWSCTDVTERVELERRMVTALEQQQQRIGHELHDGVGQLITGVRMLSQNLAERHFDKGEKGYEQAHKIVRYTQEASQILRELQRGLAPVQVHGRGLARALEELAHSTDGLPGITCTFVYDGQTDVQEDETKLQLYRIAQEATNNALKHAEPSHIQIAFRREQGRTVLSISDDGRGFDLEKAKDQSLGLHSMHYRARAVKASLDVRTAPGCGATVRCTLSNAEDGTEDGEAHA